MPPSARPGHRRGCAGRQTCGPDRQLPTCAACAGSRVPWPAPTPATGLERWYSPATSSHSRRALQARCSPSPCARLSRAPTTTRAPPPTRIISGRCALPAPQRTRRRHRSGSHVHHRSFDGIDAQLFPCGHGTTLTRTTRIVLSSRRINPPVRNGTPPYVREPHAPLDLAHIISIGFEPGSTLKGVLALVHFVTPLRLACRAHTVR